MDIPLLMRRSLELVGTPKACYTISKIISIILNRRGIPARVLFVQGMITNDRAEHLRMRCGIPRWDSEIPNGFKDLLIACDGWTMGIGIGTDPFGMPNFHAVVYLPQTDEIIDATIVQMNRPQYDLNFEQFYGSAEDYRKIYSQFFIFRLCDVEKYILKEIKPKIERDPAECGDIIKQLEEEMG